MQLRSFATICVSGLLVTLGMITLVVFQFAERMSVIVLILILGWTTLVWIHFEHMRLMRWLQALKPNALWRWQAVLAEVVGADFSPLVRTLRDHNEVALAARQLIVEVNPQPVFLDASVIFLGAAGNQSDKARKDALNLSEDSERTPAQVYQGAVEELMSGQIPVYRIVGLLMESEYQARSTEKQRQYLSWIRGQISQLKRNKNYVFFDNPRAPKWGAAGAAVVTAVGYLQFTSSGGDALFIKHERIARNVIREVMRELSGADGVNKLAYTAMDETEYNTTAKPGPYGKRVPVGQLEHHLMVLTKLTFGEKEPIVGPVAV